jgi:hypothetical protein
MMIMMFCNKSCSENFNIVAYTLDFNEKPKRKKKKKTCEIDKLTYVG